MASPDFSEITQLLALHFGASSLRQSRLGGGVGGLPLFLIHCFV